MSNQMWEPLWKNIACKFVSKDEASAIERLKDIIANKNIIVDTVLDMKGQKTLRFKKKYDNKYEIDLHDYVLLGPVLFDERKMYCRESYTIGKPNHDFESMTVLMDEDEMATHIKESLFNKKVLREAKKSREWQGMQKPV